MSASFEFSIKSNSAVRRWLKLRVKQIDKRQRYRPTEPTPAAAASTT